MWVIRGGERDLLVDRFVDDGIVAVGFPTVPDAEILTRTEMRRFLVDGGATGKGIDDDVAILSAFVNEIQVGESILLPDPRRDEVLLGEVTSRYVFDGDAPGDSQHRRTVRWLGRHAASALPSPLQKVAFPRAVLVQDRSAEWSGHVAAVRAGDVGRDPADRGPDQGPIHEFGHETSCSEGAAEAQGRAGRRPHVPVVSPPQAGPDVRGRLLRRLRRLNRHRHECDGAGGASSSRKYSSSG